MDHQLDKPLEKTRTSSFVLLPSSRILSVEVTTSSSLPKLVRPFFQRSSVAV